jgi:hypothetical protein
VLGLFHALYLSNGRIYVKSLYLSRKFGICAPPPARREGQFPFGPGTVMTTCWGVLFPIAALKFL